MIKSHCFIVSIRWVTKILVFPFTYSNTSFNTFFSVFLSKADVKSSKINISKSLESARASEILCFCPPDKLTPFSPTAVSKPLLKISLKFGKPEILII